MEITIKIEGLDGLEGAIHTLAQVLANYEMPINIDGQKVAEKVETKVEPEKEQPKQEKTQPEKEALKQEQKQADPEPAGISLETVRGKLAELAQAGKQKDVKALITEMKGKKLTDIPSEKYRELLEKAEGLL